LPEIVESITPGGKYKRIYPIESEVETIALQLDAAQASQLAVALINATRSCGRGRAVHLTAYRKTGRWTVVVVKAK
jgi:hypothetical protein